MLSSLPFVVHTAVGLNPSYTYYIFNNWLYKLACELLSYWDLVRDCVRYASCVFRVLCGMICCCAQSKEAWFQRYKITWSSKVLHSLSTQYQLIHDDDDIKRN